MALCTLATRQLEYCGLSGSHSLFAKVFDVSGNTAISSPITVSFGQLDTTLPDVHVTNVVNDGKSLRSLHRRATRKER